MYSIKVYGRDSQDVLTAAELIAWAAIYGGGYAQVFPDSSGQDTGGITMASCRLDHAPLDTREPVSSPDAILVMDATLLDQPGLFQGLRPSGPVLVNAPGSIEDQPGVHVVTVPATEISLAHSGKALPGAPMLGAFAAVSHALSPVAVRRAIAARYSGALRKASIAGADCSYARLQRTGPAPLSAVETWEAVMEAHRSP